MGLSIGPDVPFHCSSDCQQTGCPGHTLRETYSRTSDTYSFEVDGKLLYSFDDASFNALLEAHRRATEQFSGRCAISSLKTWSTTAPEVCFECGSTIRPGEANWVAS